MVLRVGVGVARKSRKKTLLHAQNFEDLFLEDCKTKSVAEKNTNSVNDALSMQVAPLGVQCTQSGLVAGKLRGNCEKLVQMPCPQG